MPDSTSRPSGTSRRRSPEQAGNLANSLFKSFGAPQPATDQPASDEPEAPTATQDEPSAEPDAAPPFPATGTATVASAGAGPAPAAERVPAARMTEERATRPASARGTGARSSAPARTTARAPEEATVRPPRPSRPRLVDPTAYATKHRNVQTARIQALLRSGDLDVLDDVARRTLDLTGEDTNRSELLRALVEGLDVARVAEQLAACGTHRQRVAFLAERLRG